MPFVKANLEEEKENLTNLFANSEEARLAQEEFQANLRTGSIDSGSIRPCRYPHTALHCRWLSGRV